MCNNVRLRITSLQPSLAELHYTTTQTGGGSEGYILLWQDSLPENSVIEMRFSPQSVSQTQKRCLMSFISSALGSGGCSLFESPAEELFPDSNPLITSPRCTLNRCELLKQAAFYSDLLRVTAEIRGRRGGRKKNFSKTPFLTGKTAGRKDEFEDVRQEFILIKSADLSLNFTHSQLDVNSGTHYTS